MTPEPGIFRNDLLMRGQPGYIHHPLYGILLDACQSVPGVFIEMGVYAGYTFRLIYRRARRYGKRMIGVDSFVGHPPSNQPGEGEMWPGKYSVGGSAAFRAEFPEALCVEGFIPEILSEIRAIQIAFAHIDLDLYESTIEALRFVWPRLSIGGILVGHDFDWNTGCAAMQAYQDWMSQNSIVHVGIEEKSIYFRKT
jgi:hypothetical protein